jgi:hypothetical protein
MAILLRYIFLSRRNRAQFQTRLKHSPGSPFGEAFANPQDLRAGAHWAYKLQPIFCSGAQKFETLPA